MTASPSSDGRAYRSATATTLAGVAVGGLCVVLLTASSQSGWPPHGVALERGYLFGVLIFVAAWTLMAGAMMLPSALPFLRALARVGGGVAALHGGAGFATTWAACGLVVAALLLAAATPLGRLGPGGVEQVAAGILLAAAAYQASPLAAGCRRACASPIATLARSWRGHRGQAFAAGLSHGVTCIGCCVPMILVMLLVGMADMRWIFALGAVTVLQKHPAWGPFISLPISCVLAGCAIAIASGAWVPELAPLRSLCVS